MLPEEYLIEPKALTDERTGRAYTQLTDWQEPCVHLYFTENSFYTGRNDILFQSVHDSRGANNLFTLSLENGYVRRLTHYLADGGVNRVTKTPDGSIIGYCLGQSFYLYYTETDSTIKLMDAPEGMTPTRVSISCDKRSVAMLFNEDVHFGMGMEYKNFARRLYAIKRSEIWLCELDGLNVGKPRRILRDTAEGGHLQFSPTDPNLIMFCHEGPWNLVTQRVYLLRTDTDELMPCFRQAQEDSVGHEFFTRDGGIYLDDRGPTHDGSILSSLGELSGGGDTDFEPFLAYCAPDGSVVTRYPLPYYFQHYHCGSDRRVLCADGERELCRIRLTDGADATIETLLYHNTSWHGQHTHPHPTVSFDDKLCLFASDKSGVVELYVTRWDD